MKKRLRFIAVALLALTAPGICRAEDGAAPFAATDWPQFRGPTQSGTTETEYELVEHLDDAKLVWISDERNLGVGWGLGHGSSGAGQTAERACGYAAPVVAGGRVFIQYFEPTGDVVDPSGEKAPIDKRPGSWKVDANDRVLCMDALSGKTLWKATLPYGRNMNVQREGNYQHPVIVPASALGTRSARLYAQGNAGYAHAVDVESGRLIWSVPLGPTARHWVRQLEAARAKQSVLLAGKGYGFNVSPAWADGVIVMNDQVPAGRETPGCGMVALEADTGAHRWTVTNAVGKMVTPVIWRHGGNTYAIGVAEQRLVCVDVADGSVVASLDERFHGSQTPSLRGDLLTVAHLGFRGGLRKEYADARRRGDIDKKTSFPQWLDMGKGLSCYRLRPDGPPEVVWELPNKFGSGNTSPALVDKYGYFHTSIGLCAIELDTGKVHRKHGAIGTYIALKAMGERLFQYGRMWDISQPATPKEAGHIGSIGGFKTVLYADGCVADGRLYLRGWIDDDSLRAGDAPERGSIACLDLRKNIVSLPVRDLLDSTQPVATKIEALTRLAWHEAPTVRADAVRALGKLEGEAPIKGLIRALGADAIDAREGAVVELTKKTSRKPVRDLLIAATRSDNAWRRACAAETLGNAGRTARDALPSLIELAKDRHPDVMYACGWALARVTGPEPLPVHCAPALFVHARDGQASKAYRCLDTIAAIGKEALPFLLNAIEKEEAAFVRWRATYAIGKVGAAAIDTIPELERLEKADPHDNVRKTIRKTIADIRNAAKRAP